MIYHIGLGIINNPGGALLRNTTIITFKWILLSRSGA